MAQLEDFQYTAWRLQSKQWMSMTSHSKAVLETKHHLVCEAVPLLPFQRQGKTNWSLKVNSSSMIVKLYLCPLSFFKITFILLFCREPARNIPLVTKVMKKEARHTQRRDRASGVPPDILEHLPPKNQSLPTLLLCALTSDFTGGCPLPPSHSLCQRVNLQLQLIKVPGQLGVFNPNPSDGSLTRLTSLPGLLQLCVRLVTVSQPRGAREA